MKVLCIDDSNRPSKIPIENWIQKDKVYTVIEVKNMGLQKDTMGYKLAEIELPENCFPYEYFSSKRFGFIVEVVDENKELSTEGAELELF